MKAIKISDEMHRKLIKFKYDLGASNIDEVIRALVKISTKTELASELNKKGGKK